ncbi:MAG: response regulator transcription factor [Solirubrobacterales bacterium]
MRKALAIGAISGASGSLAALLRGAAIELIETADGGAGLKAFYAERPDVLLLDLDLPDVNGFEVLATVRELSDVPVLAMTDHDGEGERIRALRAGADDCVTKPTSGEEIVARIEALLRRARARPEVEPVLADEFVHIDHPGHRVEVLGAEVSLTPIEFRMLATFAENPGRVLGHGQLLDRVWGDRIRDKDEVKLYVSYLRRKLAAAAGVDPVETVRGVGYRYRPRKIPPTPAKPS